MINSCTSYTHCWRRADRRSTVWDNRGNGESGRRCLLSAFGRIRRRGPGLLDAGPAEVCPANNPHDDKSIRPIGGSRQSCWPGYCFDYDQQLQGEPCL